MHIKIDGRGSLNPDILWLAEAPGEVEDRKNKVLVGRSGKFFTDVIYPVFPDLKHRLENIVRCRPPDNRDPTAEEIAACKPYLLDDIEKMKPKVIVCMGNIPLRAITGKMRITENSGRVVASFGRTQIPVVALLHPAHVLRNRAILPQWVGHMAVITKVLDRKGDDPGHKDEMPPPTTEADALLKVKESPGTVTLDFETTTLKPWGGGRIRICSFYSKDQPAWWVSEPSEGF